MDDNTTLDEVTELAPEETLWAPPEGVVRHAGAPIETDADFFAEPPPEIGELISAETTLTTRQRPWRLASRLVLVGLIGWAGYMLGDYLAKNVNAANPDDARALVWVGAAAVMLVAWFLTRFSHACSYVGKLGVAKFKCKGSRRGIRSPEVFLFEDAAELRTSQTKQYYNGVYTGTSYTFTWTDDAGNRAFKLSGTYRGENKPPKPKDPFHLAMMAEHAWSAFLFDRVVATLESVGAVRFNLTGKRYVAVGPGFLDLFVAGNEAERIEAKEIGGLEIDSGVVKIKRVGAKEGWFSSSGVYKFSYDQMANSRMFLLLYSHLIGSGAGASEPEEVKGRDDEL